MTFATRDDSVFVTGPDSFQYYQLEDGELEKKLTLINSKDRDISTKYSCHCWMPDGRLIVCTEIGEVIILEDDGAFVAFLEDSPIIQEDKFRIEVVIPMQRGFLVAGNGKIYVYEKVDDSKAPYRMITEPLEVQLDSKDNTFGSNTP